MQIGPRFISVLASTKLEIHVCFYENGCILYVHVQNTTMVVNGIFKLVCWLLCVHHVGGVWWHAAGLGLSYDRVL